MIELLSNIDPDHLVVVIIASFAFALRKIGLKGAEQHAISWAPLIKEAVKLGLDSLSNTEINENTKDKHELAAIIKTMPASFKLLSPIAARKAASKALTATTPLVGNEKRLQSIVGGVDLNGKEIGTQLGLAFKRGDLTFQADTDGKVQLGFKVDL